MLLQFDCTLTVNDSVSAGCPSLSCFRIGMRYNDFRVRFGATNARICGENPLRRAGWPAQERLSRLIGPKKQNFDGHPMASTIGHGGCNIGRVQGYSIPT